ncbi:MAG: 5-formyltetrahydrofolate cyclo-ligase [Thermoguttaceae bacterium]|nr:5-formyltetrahydrofolate cyclo-ligase [Thermoguttaceae bacterium]MBQ9799251.1 5-formyltetrahydrofolate cyclo-ligase [Thermoguttaceae bacterium]
MTAFPAPPDAEIAAAKKALRQELKRRLRDLRFDRLAVAAQIFRNLERLPEFVAAQTLAVYLDFGFEAPIRPFLPRLFERRDRVVAVPRCVERELEFYRLDPPRFLDAAFAPLADQNDFLDRDAFSPERAFRLSDLTSGAFGIWEPLPNPSRLLAPAAFDLVLVPGLAFDLDGGRLGRGAGFYDRFLATLPPKTRLVGVALDEQLVEKTPRDAFDLPVDALATPTRLTVFSK